MFKISLGPYLIQVSKDTIPTLWGEYRQRATLYEEFTSKHSDRANCFVTVAAQGQWPILAVEQAYAPSSAGFDPGILLVRETKTLFIGAGERLLAYQLDPLKRLWEDKCDLGFWGWSQHTDCVLMAAEIELAAWDYNGNKLWTTFVEPPWDYRVEGSRVYLDVMGAKSEFGLAEGRGPP